MSKTLVIAEKPSVAADIARVLGRLERKDDAFENDQYIVSSAVGHLVELAVPSEMEVKRGKWSFANLPILPKEFDLKPIEANEDRFKMLKRLMKRADVAEIVNACDAGREGELIFRFLVKLAGVHKPVKRLWLQSMTADSIRQAFTRLRTDEEMMPLANAAFCRAESDWLVGINGTRAMTAFNSKAGGFQLTPVGRVQTPTLAILVEREKKIRAFKARTYFEVFGDFDVTAGQYRGRWFDETFKRGADEDARPERLWDREKAEAIRAKCLGKAGIVTEEKKAATQASPLLFDLTSLQRDANGRFGFSARRTLQIAQQLYERFKVLTYPRTDSRHLPQDYLNTVKETMGSFEDPVLSAHAQKALASGWVRMSPRIFDDTKVSDHNAIIPTGLAPKSLDEAQQKIFDLVARRFIAVFYPAAQFEVTTRLTRVEGEIFKTDGRIIKDAGWMAVYGREAAASGEGAEADLAPIRQGEPATAAEVEVRQSDTRPPPRYNEATLLATMEGAGKLIDSEELREALSAKGLGTPATRAAIIEGLIMDSYIARNGRELSATPKGISLIALLRGIGIAALCSPEMTGEWESKLKLMEQGGLERSEFMAQIRGLTEDIVNKAKNFQGETVDGDFGELDVQCPKCGARPLKEEYRVYRCPTCDYVFWKSMAGRQFDPEEIKTLLTERRVGPLEGFRSKEGRPFNAPVKLGLDSKPEFDFPAAKEAPDFTELTPLHHCTVCDKGEVYVTETAYVCSKAFGPEKGCSFRMSKTILQREVPPDEVIKLLETGKTSLLTKFISKRNRPFSAYLKLEKGGKVKFEFEPRSKDAKGGAAAKGRRGPAKAKAGAKAREKQPSE